MEWIIIVIYGICLLFIFMFSLTQLHLTWHYLKSKKEPTIPTDNLMELPLVTVQLPVYNEKYVLKRLIDKICKLNYPKDKLEIQILDDSTDKTVDIIKSKLKKLAEKGLNIQYITRPNRKGYKAGALQYGMERAKGEFLAIFDADFLPGKDFLLKTIPKFQNDKIGVVQTRWGHVNQNYSLLTKMQAFGLDAHFTIEQTGRNHAGSFINFNGTAGIWRKSCIMDAGGWSADTLTEDLDLSYRAQLKNWKFKYLEQVVAPAELPVIMPAIKSQQYRWNKGGAETAKKHFGNVLKSNMRFIQKVHAFFHLFNSSIFLSLLITSILSIPMLYIKYSNPELEMFFYFGSIFLFGFLSIGFFYWIAAKVIQPKDYKSYFFKRFPLFLIFSMGLSLHNAIAVVEGLLGFKSPFIRTPKFNIFKKEDNWKTNEYIKPKFTFQILLEGLLCVYFTFGIVSGFQLKDYGLIFFHIMLALGFGIIFFHSLKPLNNV